VPQAEPQYEPEVMERYAALLEHRARSLLRGFTIAGALFGGIVGALPLTPAGTLWPVPHLFGFTSLVLGAAAGGVIGHAVARHRAGMLRLQAQSTLCQLHAQRTTLALWLLVKEQALELVPAAAREPEPEAAPAALVAAAPEPVTEEEPPVPAAAATEAPAEPAHPAPVAAPPPAPAVESPPFVPPPPAPHAPSPAPLVPVHAVLAAGPAPAPDAAAPADSPAEREPDPPPAPAPPPLSPKAFLDY
jgi:hypothetical protein